MVAVGETIPKFISNLKDLFRAIFVQKVLRHFKYSPLRGDVSELKVPYDYVLSPLETMLCLINAVFSKALILADVVHSFTCFFTSLSQNVG